MRARARAGLNRVRLRVPARTGRYRVRVFAVSGDGQRATGGTRLIVAKR